MINMGGFKIIKENGKVIIEDKSTSLFFDDNSRLAEKIKSNPHLNYWEKQDLLKELGLDGK